MSRILLHPDTTMIRGRARGAAPFRRCGVLWPPTPDKGLPVRKLPWREEPVSRFTPAQLQFLLDSAELVIEQNGEGRVTVTPAPEPPLGDVAPEPLPGAPAVAEQLDATTDHAAEQPEQPELATPAATEELTDLDAESAAAGEADEAEADPAAAAATRRHRSHGKGGKK